MAFEQSVSSQGSPWNSPPQWSENRKICELIELLQLRPILQKLKFWHWKYVSQKLGCLREHENNFYIFKHHIFDDMYLQCQNFNIWRNRRRWRKGQLLIDSNNSLGKQRPPFHTFHHPCHNFHYKRIKVVLINPGNCTWCLI